jgi:hypothetical protein
MPIFTRTCVPEVASLGSDGREALADVSTFETLRAALSEPPPANHKIASIVDEAGTEYVGRTPRP